MGNIEGPQDLMAPLHLEWTSIFMRISANIHCVTERVPRSARRHSPAVTRVQLDDLVRLEGEGGWEPSKPAAPGYPQEQSA